MLAFTCNAEYDAPGWIDGDSVSQSRFKIAGGYYGNNKKIVDGPQAGS